VVVSVVTAGADERHARRQSDATPQLVRPIGWNGRQPGPLTPDVRMIIAGMGRLENRYFSVLYCSFHDLIVE